MVTRMTVDGEQRDVQDYRDGRWPAWVRCDFTRPRPCVDVVPGGLGLNTAALTDGTHRMRVEAVDAAGNVGGVTHDIHVDNHAPAKPERPGAGGRRGLARGERLHGAVVEPGRAGRRRSCVRGTGSASGVELHRGQPRGRGPRVAAAPGPGAGRVHAACLAGGRRRQPRRRARERSRQPALRRRGADRRLRGFRPRRIRSRSWRPSPTVVRASWPGRSRRAAPGEPVWRDLGARLGGDRLVGSARRRGASGRHLRGARTRA